MIRRNSGKRYFIWVKIGKHSQMEIKISRSPNLLTYLICIISANKTVHQGMFDLKSFITGVENNASKTISNHRYHLNGNFIPLPHQHTKGISGQISIKGQRTVRWRIEDDEVRVHTLDIKEALYVPKSPIFILCPQHLAQQANNNLPAQRWTYM